MFDRLIAEWLGGGRSYLNIEGLTVSRVIAEFWAYAMIRLQFRDERRSSSTRGRRHPGFAYAARDTQGGSGCGQRQRNYLDQLAS